MRILGVGLLVGVWVFACNGDEAAMTVSIPTEAGGEPTVDSGEPPQPGVPDATVSDDASNTPELGDASDADALSGDTGSEFDFALCSTGAQELPYEGGLPDELTCSNSVAETWNAYEECDDRCPLWWGCGPYEEAKQALSVCSDAGPSGVTQGWAAEGCGYLILVGERRDPSWGLYDPDTGELVATWVMDDVEPIACSGEVPMACVGWDPFEPSPLPMVDLCASDAGSH